MGILRTDKISGLETPTAVTGSVYFDGSDDSLTLPNSCGFDSSVSYTVEMWVKDVEVPSGSSPFFTFGASGSANQTFNIDYTSVGNLRLDYYSNAIDFSIDLNDGNWHHIAATYDGTTRRLFADGFLGASDATTNGAYVATNVRVGRMNWISRFAKCYISNLRVVTGTALYTSNFTVPTHALEVIDGTILLCCNNKDNAAAIDHANIGVSKSITINGGAAASTFSPSLTRDFTYGTEFRGVTTFDTQGYFVPPSGTTEQRGRGRGLFALGAVPGTFYTDIQYVNIASQGNSINFGSLTGELLPGREGSASVSSETRGIFAGGYHEPTGRVNAIHFVTISTTGNSVNFGDLSSTKNAFASFGSSTRGCFAGGASSPTTINTIEYVTIASLGDAQNFGDLTAAKNSFTGCSSPTRGITNGGYTSDPTDVIEYVTIASTGNAQDFGNLQNTISNSASCSSSVRGISSGGASPSRINTIDYITIASTGNAQDFGDLTAARNLAAGTSNKILGIFGGGATPSRINTIDYITIASTGNAQDFGDFGNGGSRSNLVACSDSHGGLS